ncbi:hypothetical protein OG799_03690 [Micromonospora sp. NBC_00898]|uniref:hypothetical protein n=1 Tax=Micromonospora sp. NBC_00898 TaxID=2975981 RepID=UPI0038637971|nr:hypothetical protein OG799_03690 [Micromonospora sp. NBC_00898]
MFELVYELLLMLGGIALIVIGLAIREQGTGSRILNLVVGLGFFGYGFYLMFLAPVGTRYTVFYYAFILPVLLIVRAVKARKEAKEAQAAAGHQHVVPGQVYPASPGQYGPPQGQPGHPTN